MKTSIKGFPSDDETTDCVGEHDFRKNSGKETEIEKGPGEHEEKGKLPIKKNANEFTLRNVREKREKEEKKGYWGKREVLIRVVELQSEPGCGFGTEKKRGGKKGVKEKRKKGFFGRGRTFSTLKAD